MTKYTINKVFEKQFHFPVWKIEVDYNYDNLAVESRNPETTIPSFSVYSFEGKTRLDELTVNEKEWTLAAIQGDYLVLKKYGESTPIQAGIKIIQISTQKIIADFSEYIFKESYENIIVAIHRSIPSGLTFYIDIRDGNVKSNLQGQLKPIDSIIEYPSEYIGKLPHFMETEKFEDKIWIQKYEDIFIWAYHEKSTIGLELKIILSSKNQILKKETVISNLDRLILQPYFKVKRYIFFLSNTKQNISTYLV